MVETCCKGYSEIQNAKKRQTILTVCRFIPISDQFHEKIRRQALADQGKRPQAGCSYEPSLLPFGHLPTPWGVTWQGRLTTSSKCLVVKIFMGLIRD